MYFNRKIYWLSCFLFFLLALILRFWGIFYGSFAFTYDTGRDLLAVRDLVYNHKFSLIGPTSGQMGIFYGPWWYWILTIPFIISNGNPFVILGFIAFYGALSVVIAFFWGNYIKKPFFGIILGGVLAVAPFFIASTTQLWNPDLLPTTTAGVIFLLAIIGGLNWFGWLLFGFLTMLLIETEIIFGVVFAIGLLVGLFLFYREKIFSRFGTWFFIGALIVELPRIFFELRHDFLQTKTFFSFFNQIKEPSVNIFDRLNIFFHNFLVLLPEQNKFLLIIILSIVSLVVWQNRKVISEEGKRFIQMLVIIILTFFLFTIFYPKAFWDYYLLGLPVILVILIVYAIAQTIKKNAIRSVMVLIIIYLFFLSSPRDLIKSWQNPKFVGNAAVFRNQLIVLDYVYKEANGENFNYIAYTPPQIEYTWRYLFWWYGKNKYGYEPQTYRQEKFFVIIEPDPGYEGRITMWLRIREGDGVAIKEEQLPSGIIVQTRARPKE